MAFQPKTKPRSLPRSIPTANKKEYGEMSISDLVTVLRTAYKTEDFDKIEQELVKREAKLRAEIGPLREKIELERLERIEVEERLKIREEQYKKGKRAQNNYEQLLKEVKTGGLVEKHAIEELRKKNVALQREVYELKEFRKKMLDDVKSMNELRDKIRVLKGEKVGDKNALDVLIMKNIELEEAVKKNLTVIEGLKNENGKLTETLFESLERRYKKLRVSDVKLEESTMPLMSEDPSNCGNTEVEPSLGASFAVKDEKDVSDHELENDTGEPIYLQRDEDTHYSVDTGTCQSPKKGNKEDAVGALGVTFKLEKEIVDLSDDEDDDDKYTSQGLHGEKAISQIIEENEYPQWVEIIKRKRASDIQASTSTSTSSADLFENANLPVKKTPMATPTPGTPLLSSPSLSLSWQSRYLTSPPASFHNATKVLVKKLRGSTRLRTLTRRINEKRLQVYIDAATGRPSGPNRVTFTSYLGALAREKVSILHPSWDQVNESTKKLLWEDILAHFDIVPSEAVRGKTLSSIASMWRHFKTYLTTRWALNEDKINRGMTPCNMYGINEDTWRQFVQIRSTASWEKKRKKPQEVQTKNDTPHRFSRGGYQVLEEKLMAEKIKLREEHTSECDIEPRTNTSPPSPPSRHVKWKRARMTSSGQFTSESALQIAKRIDSLEMQSKQGMFHPSGHQDILTTAIGFQEHLYQYIW
ncbi:hypothetical protein LR48_Vigan07g014000 [Vigna angularis]|uniref:Uncharacterized protein n=2 Tax=Phaseolus angularis TaxID=3914 RepID=A0A0L9UUN1_PHAAN|nr:uncharacterized protein LOC108338714 [Vigna angularis]XP_052736353.1 uncharacterized protein LOC108338714 [Vigna angularis]XP_052736354.1 uncharacterized protein LOC108338714 [Vigna angularis]KOM46436.1 hypothetical protein LR48_Vigan07g014000 [Vigna angularis]